VTLTMGSVLTLGNVRIKLNDRTTSCCLLIKRESIGVWKCEAKSKHFVL
jgi:hypothetical protein